MGISKKLMLCAVAGVCILCADQVTLKNGDRLTGTIIASDGKALTLKSEFAGTVSIDWNAVDVITSGAPLYLTLKSGQILVGPVETTNGSIMVKTTDAGTVTTSKTEVQVIRSKEAQEAYQASEDRMRNPGLLDLWNGFVDTGLNMSRGNSDTTAFNLGMNAARTTKRDKISVNFVSLYSKNKVNGASILAADAIRGGIRYDMNVSDRVFGFGFTSEEYDKFQHLDLRAVFGGGIGDHIIKHERTTFDLYGGGSLNKEFYTTLSRTSGEALVGEEFMHKVGKSTIINERFTFFPNLSSVGDYRMSLNASAVTSINKWLAFQFTLSDIYVTNPPPTIKKNDMLLSTGLRVTFAR